MKSDDAKPGRAKPLSLPQVTTAMQEEMVRMRDEMAKVLGSRIWAEEPKTTPGYGPVPYDPVIWTSKPGDMPIITAISTSASSVLAVHHTVMPTYTASSLSIHATKKAGVMVCEARDWSGYLDLIEDAAGM